MNESGQTEGRAGIARTEAFSDAVLAIIMTIMVLELEAPHEQGFSALWSLWPTFFAYVLSYAYIAIYWINHHRLFTHARMVTGELIRFFKGADWDKPTPQELLTIAAQRGGR